MVWWRGEGKEGFCFWWRTLEKIKFCTPLKCIPDEVLNQKQPIFENKVKDE
jgi:hypothetical protein